jgi:ribosome biogenesis GTPase / thiamine phosphate phosphatase
VSSTPDRGGDGSSSAAAEIDDLALLTPTLASLGWTAEHEQWAQGLDDPTGPALIRGRLARVSRGFSLVFTGGDALLAASGTGRTGLDSAPATGDFVLIRDDPDDGPILAAIAERTTALRRRAPGRLPGPQVLAANADAVLVMHGLDRPLNLRRLERQLVVAWDSGAEPIVVLTKVDAAPDPDAIAAEVAGAALGVEVIAISVVSGRNLDRLGELLATKHSMALLGLSGIGKSSLVNKLSNGQVQRTGEVRAGDNRGRHTTVTRDLIPLPGGQFMIDTPGVREIGLWQAHEGLAKTFPEIEEVALKCRFANCEHRLEPGCQVRAAVVRGAIEERRVEHYRELQGELTEQDEQLEEHDRRSESRARAEAEDTRDQTRSNRKVRDRPRRRPNR